VSTHLIPDNLDARLRDPRLDPDTQLTLIRDWLDQLDPAAWLAELCDQVIARTELAGQLGDDAVEHPNGFNLINLAGGVPRPNRLPPYRVRLHIWWSQQRKVIEDVHNHAWNFASRVLTGTLRFITYTPTDEPHAQPFCWYPYRFGSDGAYTAQHVQRVRLRPALDATLPTGTRYSFDHQQLHRVVPLAEGPTATLVVAGQYLRDGSDIYTEQPRHATGARIPHQPLGPEAVRERLARLHDTIRRTAVTSPT
jgi:hypothetical protein